MFQLNTKNKKIGLALEGGGAKGSYEIGAYIALKKCGVKIDMAAGTSIGSLNAALIVQGDMKLARDLWMKSNSEIIGLNTEIVKNIKSHKLSANNIKMTIQELKKIISNKGLDITNYKTIIKNNIDEEKIRKSNIDYGLVTVRIKDIKPIEITIKDIEQGKLHEYILASSYLPVFKQNKIIDDSYYFDGGISNNLPITLLEKNGCGKIYAIRINGVGSSKKQLYKNTEVIEIKPTKDTGPVILFENSDVQNNYYMGYYDTLLYMNKLEGNKYYFKKYKYYNYLIRKVDNKLLNLIKLIYKEPDIKDIILKSVENILENNKIEYYKIYKVPKIIKYIKKNKLKSKNTLITKFVYSLKLFIE